MLFNNNIIIIIIKEIISLYSFIIMIITFKNYNTYSCITQFLHFLLQLSIDFWSYFLIRRLIGYIIMNYKDKTKNYTDRRTHMSVYIMNYISYFQKVIMVNDYIIMMIMMMKKIFVCLFTINYLID